MVIDMDELREQKIPHQVFEGICLRCLYRGIIVAPTKLWLKDIICSKCGLKGYIIKTGQDLEVKNGDK